jgi:rare lipoprotein A
VGGSLAQRLVVLAGLALLAAVLVYAFTDRSDDEASGLPPPSGSYTALAGTTGEAAFGRRTVCGQVIRPTTQGVAHPVLPCGARVYVSFRNRHVLTQVIDRGPYEPGRTFELTPALARQLGLSGVRRITWSYAAAG